MKNWFWAALPLAILILVLVAMPIAGPEYRGPTYLAAVVLMAVELGVIGYLVNDRPAGAFVDNRNRLSLSKLQAAGWTVVVLAGFGTAAAFNIAAAMYQSDTVTALAITIPGELLIAMGISATSLVATPALLTIKSHEPADDKALEKARARKTVGGDVAGNGKVLVRCAPENASWSDLVTGEEVGNAGTPDLGKIQQLFITLLLLGCYAAYLYASLDGSQEVVTTLPTLDKSFVWLLGVSHASYLAYKAAPHTTPSAPDTDAAS